MSFKTTGFLAALFIALLGFLYFYEIRGGEGRKQAETEARKVLRIDDTEVVRLVVQREDTTVVAVREGDGWRILEPLKTGGDRANIESLLRTGKKLEKVQVVADEASLISGAVDPADFGLGKPEITVVFEREGEQRDSLFFGDKSPTGSYVYLRVSGSPEILAVGAWRKSNFAKGLYDLRDKRVVLFDRDEVRKFEIARDGQVIVASKQGGDWRLEKPVADRGDSLVIRRLLSRLWTAQAKRFVTEEATDLAPYGLDDPWMRISIYEGEGLALKEVILGDGLRAGRIKRYYGKYVAKSPVFTVDSTFVKEMMKTPSELRYKKIFAFDSEGIDRVVLVYPDSTVDCRKDTSSQAWTTLEPRFHAASGKSVEDLIERVKELEAVRFAAETLVLPETYGLDAPAVQVKLWKAGQLAREVALGRKGEQVYARGDARPQVVEVGRSILERLTLELSPFIPDSVQTQVP